jgi:lysophospholipase L1-like esterase
VATGTFPNTAAEQEIVFPPKLGQYVRLRALSEVGGLPFTAVAEFTVLQAAGPPAVQLLNPQSYAFQTGKNLYVMAEACLNGGQGIRLVLDGGASNGGAECDGYHPPYEGLFTGLSPAEHMVDAFVIDGAGSLVPGATAHSRAVQIGIGDYFVAIGDSITYGIADDVPQDNVSYSGRNRSGGYTPVLENALVAFTGRPAAVYNEGVPGYTSTQGAALVPTLLQRHVSAQYFIIMFGANDATYSTPSGLGLNVGDSGYSGSFKHRMQTIIDAVRGAGKIPILAKTPPILPLDGPRDVWVQRYNQVVAELAQAPTNQVAVAPPDFYSYFRTNVATQYPPGDAYHPNGVGYQAMAALWFYALSH